VYDIATKHRQICYLKVYHYFYTSFLKAHKTATLHHFRRIADFLEIGEGVWFKVHDGGVEFKDGKNCPDNYNSGPILTHFR